MKSVLRFPFYAKASLICIGLVTFISALFILQDIILPIIYATIIAIVLSPFVNFLVRKKCNRILAISFILLIVFIITLSLVALLSSQVMQFSETLPKLIEKFNELIDQSKEWTSDYFNISTRKINLWLTSKNKELLSGSTGFIGDTLVQTGNVLIVLVLVPVYVFMFLFYQPFLIEFIHKLFKSSNQHDINKLLSATKKIIQSYLVGLLLEAGIIAVLNSSALLIIGIDYAILLGVIGAILNVIPYLGGIIAVALPMAIALATKSSSTYCFLVLGAYIFIQFIDNNYIVPKVVASKVKINALVSIIVVIGGGALWGIPGMFLSIPITAILKIIFDHIESLKPWGFLLGDTMTTFPILKIPFIKK